MDKASILSKQVKKFISIKVSFILALLLCLYSTLAVATQKPTQPPAEKSSQAINTSIQPWHIWREDDELIVSYRTSAYKDLIEIKAQAKLTSSIAGFIYFIEDLTQLHHWLDNAESAKIISQTAINENTFVTHFKGLWPVAAREMVVHSRYWQNEDLSVEISVEDASASIAVTPDTIRMQVLKAHWQIVPTKVNQIEIRYQFIVDPKGNIPQWLTKPMTLNGIWTTLNNMREQLPNSKWQQKRRVDIKELH